MTPCNPCHRRQHGKAPLRATRELLAMDAQIKSFSETIGINFLVHFTSERNLASILQRGLVTRDILAREGGAAFNDAVRLDGTHAVCVSIGFPNYKMFYSLRQKSQDENWVIVAIDRSALWELPTAFCIANAASTVVTSTPIHYRKGVAALQRMYAEFNGKHHQELGIKEYLPTNPQAEVLMLSGVPRNFILGLITPSTAAKQRLEATYPGVKVLVGPAYFSYRADYAHWQ